MALEAAVCSSWEVGSLGALSVPDLNPLNELVCSRSSPTAFPLVLGQQTGPK